MNGRFQMQGGKNWFLPKEMNANRFFWDSHWLEIWSNHFYPSMGPNGGSVAMDSGRQQMLGYMQQQGCQEEQGHQQRKGRKKSIHTSNRRMPATAPANSSRNASNHKDAGNSVDESHNSVRCFEQI
jgi:hypothetical protein